MSNQEKSKRKYVDTIESEKEIIDRDYVPLKQESYTDGYNTKGSLPVAESISNPELGPKDGMEYLLMVRNDARALPNVVVSKKAPPKLDTQYKQLPLSKMTSQRIGHYVSLINSQPNQGQELTNNIDPDWQCNLLTKFREQKQKFHIELKSFKEFQTNIKFPTKGTEFEFLTDENQQYKTVTPKILAQLQYYHLIILLQYFADSDNQIPGLGPHLISAEQSQWIYAILLRLDDLLEADAIAILRDLARRCIKLVKIDLSEQYTQDKIDEHITYCNTVITLVALHFGQRDLIM